MDMPHVKSRQSAAFLPGLAAALMLGIVLLLLHFAARAFVPATPLSAHRALLRLRGSLFLILAAWYGRCVLLPFFRWRAIWWFYLPGLILIGVMRPPFDAARILALARGGVLLAAFLSGLELLAAVLRQAWRMPADDLPARESGCRAARRAAGSLCFAAALMAGAGLYLFGIDYAFDYFLYSGFACLLAAACYLAPLAVLAARLENGAEADRARIAALEQAALSGEATPEAIEALTWAGLARRALAQDTPVRLSFWDLLRPAASCALLLLAAFLYGW